jgi:putative CocE/NonD family hydrolase
MEAGAFDQRESGQVFGARHPGRELSARDDVISFASEPLPQDVEIVGPVVAHLWVSTAALDTDFTVKLVDVHPPSVAWPAGYAMNLTDGILRFRFRESFARPRPAQPDEVCRIEITASPTANRFLAGHRIRVDVSSSNFPRFDVNPNSGAAAGEPSTPVIAMNCVYTGPERASHIVLSVMPAGDRQAAK